MKIDFGKILTDLDGTPIPDGAKVLTLAAVSANALLLKDQQDNIDELESRRRYDLAAAIYKATEPYEVAPADILLIKKQINKGFAILVSGQALPLLDVAA